MKQEKFQLPTLLRKPAPEPYFQRLFKIFQILHPKFTSLPV